MKELYYFYLSSCPYCRQAGKWLEELKAENPRYAAVNVRFIEETKEKALADAYDYYLVPTFFLGNKKLHEGIADKEKLRAVLEAASEDA